MNFIKKITYQKKHIDPIVALQEHEFIKATIAKNKKIILTCHEG